MRRWDLVNPTPVMHRPRTSNTRPEIASMKNVTLHLALRRDELSVLAPSGLSRPSRHRPTLTSPPRTREDPISTAPRDTDASFQLATNHVAASLTGICATINHADERGSRTGSLLVLHRVAPDLWPLDAPEVTIVSLSTFSA
jgi:hypothetical protein